MRDIQEMYCVLQVDSNLYRAGDYNRGVLSAVLIEDLSETRSRDLKTAASRSFCPPPTIGAGVADSILISKLTGYLF